MENQHRKITGYRELSQEEIDLMNEVTAKGAELGELIRNIRKLELTTIIDGRWVSIGETHLQQGLMALRRAIARPNSF